jgi:methionyl-tRNA formyltransferase
MSPPEPPPAGPNLLNIVFMGTPVFAVPSLRILLEHGYAVCSVVTAPDTAAGRGQRVGPSPVKRFALEHGLTILQPDSLSDPAFAAHLRALAPDLVVVVAFRILPQSVFTIPKLGAFNLHASLLPKYRGAAPINWAIIRGERETGVTTFFLRESVDTGNIILQARVPIAPEETAGELHDVLADVGAEIVLHTVRLIETGKASTRPQDDAQASPAPKLFKHHCRIDWKKPPDEIVNFVRGLSPRPCATSGYHNALLRIYRAAASDHPPSGTPGEILASDRRLIVGAAGGAVELLELQLEGKKRMTAEEFLRGTRIAAGEVLSDPE